MSNYEQPQLFTSDPAQDEIAMLRAELRRLEIENHVLKAEKRHWQIASEYRGHGGFATMTGHAVREDGVSIQAMIEGVGITIFVDKDSAMSYGWMEDEDERT